MFSYNNIASLPSVVAGRYPFVSFVLFPSSLSTRVGKKGVEISIDKSKLLVKERMQSLPSWRTAGKETYGK